MVVFSGTEDQFSRPVLKTLESCDISLIGSQENSIAIIDARQYKRAYYVATGIKVQVATDTGDVPEVQIQAATES